MAEQRFQIPIKNKWTAFNLSCPFLLFEAHNCLIYATHGGQLTKQPLNETAAAQVHQIKNDHIIAMCALGPDQFALLSANAYVSVWEVEKMNMLRSKQHALSDLQQLHYLAASNTLILSGTQILHSIELDSLAFNFSAPLHQGHIHQLCCTEEHIWLQQQPNFMDSFEIKDQALQSLRHFLFGSGILADLMYDPSRGVLIAAADNGIVRIWQKYSLTLVKKLTLKHSSIAGGNGLLSLGNTPYFISCRPFGFDLYKMYDGSLLHEYIFQSKIWTYPTPLKEANQFLIYAGEAILMLDFTNFLDT